MHPFTAKSRIDCRRRFLPMLQAAAAKNCIGETREKPCHPNACVHLREAFSKKELEICLRSPMPGALVRGLCFVRGSFGIAGSKGTGRGGSVALLLPASRNHGSQIG